VNAHVRNIKEIDVMFQDSILFVTLIQPASAFLFALVCPIDDLWRAHNRRQIMRVQTVMTL